ncbi:MAG: immunity 17 family protein [Anaerolineae bacterium]|nr:immunity 17 family protein [Anaerolineae bacterium]
MGFLVLLIGIFTLAGAFFDWEWFMNNRRARLLVTLFSRDGARIFCAALGIFFIILSLLAFVGVLNFD